MLEQNAAVPAANPTDDEPQLERTLSLPLLVFYGLGVTVGAGIFALVGEILGIAGDHAALAFLLAGVIAGFTGVSYMALVAQFPRAGGEAVYVNRGLGRQAGRFAGLGVVVTGIISSAVVAQAFSGYVATLVSVPKWLTAAALVLLLTAVAWWGVRESVIVASIVTVLEVGTLLAVALFGLPEIELDVVARGFDLSGAGTTSAVLTGAGIAFFAYPPHAGTRTHEVGRQWRGGCDCFGRPRDLADRRAVLNYSKRRRCCSSTRTAIAAAWVRRVTPSFAKRFEM